MDCGRQENVVNRRCALPACRAMTGRRRGMDPRDDISHLSELRLHDGRLEQEALRLLQERTGMAVSELQGAHPGKTGGLLQRLRDEAQGVDRAGTIKNRR